MVTAVSGSGPAFLAYLLNCIVDAGVLVIGTIGFLADRVFMALTRRLAGAALIFSGSGPCFGGGLSDNLLICRRQWSRLAGP